MEKAGRRVSFAALLFRNSSSVNSQSLDCNWRGCLLIHAVRLRFPAIANSRATRASGGSPYNIFLVPSKLKQDGDVLTEKAWITNGELIEAEAEEFIRKRLDLKEEKEEKKKDKGDEKTASQS